MHHIYLKLLLVLMAVWGNSAQGQSDSHQVLLFTKTEGFRHENIEEGVKVFTELFARQGIHLVHTEDAAVFRSDSIANFQAVVFFSTTGDIFSAAEKKAFQRFLSSGKGFMGIHAATDTEYHWEWYGDLVGGYFASHPEVQPAELLVKDHDHPATKHLPGVWLHRDEWYDFKDLRSGLHVVMELNEQSYKGGKMGKYHPIAWYQEFEGIRMFYTGLGHTREALYDSDFQKHVLGGMQYVLGIHQD